VVHCEELGILFFSGFVFWFSKDFSIFPLRFQAYIPSDDLFDL
jgi:hypothetical protein